MNAPRTNTRLGLGLCLALGLAGAGQAGCVARVIIDGACGDGIPSRGELCLGQGPRSELRIEGLDGLLLRVADFDGDAHLDLLVLGTAPAGVVTSRLWRGRGDGTFEDALDPGATGCSAYAVAGDVNGDDARDLLVDDCGPTVSIFAGTPEGAFVGPTTVVTGVETRSSGLLDLDDDGQREVVVLGADPADDLYGISVCERSPDGSFAPPAFSPLGQPSAGFDPFGMGFLDLDRDGTYDALLIQSGEPGGLAVAPGLPSLGFGPPQPVGPPQLVPTSTMVRDLDEDGLPDVLAFSFEEEALVFLRATEGQLVEAGRTEVPGLRTGPAGAGDLDGDEHVDLLLFEPGTRRLQAWLGQGTGLFDGPEDLELDAPVGQIALADLDEDGALDIVVGTFEAGTLQILLSDP